MNKLGLLGEKLAAKYLKKWGYKIIEQNFKVKYGEIDIVAKEDDCICFIEVKSRTSNLFSEPYEAVDYKKIKKLYFLADIWLNNYATCNTACRFDIVSILFNENHSFEKIELIKEAF